MKSGRRILRSAKYVVHLFVFAVADVLFLLQKAVQECEKKIESYKSNLKRQNREIQTKEEEK